MANICNITKEKILSKNSTKNVTWKLVPGPFGSLENKLEEQVDYIGYVMAKHQNMSKRACMYISNFIFASKKYKINERLKF